MSEPFGAAYARTYDPLYQDKDYTGECDLIERTIQSYGSGTPATVLDLGCGTGNHTIELARRGYEVVGVDRSTWMVAEAQRKAALEPHVRVTVRQGDLRGLDLQRRFDVVLMMFAVLGYQLEDADVLAALGTARRHLPSGGLLLFDVWYGPAVLQQRPSARMKSVPVPGGQVIRSAESTLNVERHLCTVHFHVERMEGGNRTAEMDEAHPMRYFFRDELDRFITASNFSLLRLGVFPAFDEEPDESSWNVLAVARAV